MLTNGTYISPLNIPLQQPYIYNPACIPLIQAPYQSGVNIIPYVPLPVAAYPYFSPYPAASLPSKESLLAAAYVQNDLPQMRALLQTGGIRLNHIMVKNQGPINPLILDACHTGKTEALDLLIQYGANLDIQNLEGESVLSLTYHHINDDTTLYQRIKFLLQNKIGPDVSDHKVSGPYYYSQPLLVSAWREKKMDIFKLLLQYKADPNAYCQDDEMKELSRPLLMEAYMKGDTETVGLLLKHGADQEACEYWDEDSTRESFASLQKTKK